MSWRTNIDLEGDSAELTALLTLRMLPGLADDRLKNLLSRHTPLSILQNADATTVGERAMRALRSGTLERRVTAALRMIENHSVTVMTQRSSLYPPQLRVLAEFAPPVLFCRGRTELLEKRGVAIVGARDSTEYGDAVADMFATDFARCGIVVISGLARGIDSIAHKSALEAGGDTIAVLGCGIDVHYPPRNARLQDRIAEDGLLISEYAPGEPAFPRNFPKRNRLIARLGSAVIVVEAGPKSGTRKTVDWALSYNVDVFAVPGPIGRYECQGTNEIIQEGATLITSVRDVMETLGWNAPNASPLLDDAVPVTITSESARTIFGRLGANPVHVDEIARRCRLSVPSALGELVQLELDGYVRQHPGKRFSRCTQPAPADGVLSRA